MKHRCYIRGDCPFCEAERRAGSFHPKVGKTIGVLIRDPDREHLRALQKEIEEGRPVIMRKARDEQ